MLTSEDGRFCQRLSHRRCSDISLNAFGNAACCSTHWRRGVAYHLFERARNSPSDMVCGVVGPFYLPFMIQDNPKPRKIGARVSNPKVPRRDSMVTVWDTRQDNVRIKRVVRHISVDLLAQHLIFNRTCGGGPREADVRNALRFPRRLGEQSTG